jgi:methionyl-tRNA formyltransferase
MRLVFCGTPQFAVPTFHALLDAGHQIALALVQPDRAAGRGLEVRLPAVKQAALARAVPVAQPVKLRDNQELQQQLAAIAPDAIIVVAYGRIIPPWMLALPRFGNLNLHGSLLPLYRGAAPIQWAIARGATETGVTTMRLDAGLDTGDILLQRRVPVGPDQTAADLFPVLATVGAVLMVETLAGLENGTVKAKPQDSSQATLAPILTRDDARIDWTRPAQEIYNRWRGFQPWPGARTRFRQKNLTIHAMRPAGEHAGPAAPGTMHRAQDRMLVACGNGTLLELLEVQLEGKRRMQVSAFFNGYAPTPGEQLG